MMFCLYSCLYSQPEYVGVNLAGAEFGSSHLPGTYNKDYTYPTKSEVDYFISKGMNIFRLTFKWERLQINAYENLNSAELSRIKNLTDYISSKDGYVILEPHNYARYYDDIIGTDDLPVEIFEDFWSKLSAEFKNNPNVIFGIMNEPYGMTTELWLEDANAAITAIRSTEAVNLILVPGNAYTGAHSWNANWYGTPNGQAMLNVADPCENYAFEVHQYFDDNSSGTSETCVSTSIGSSRLKDFTAWLRKYEKRGFLGEFGISPNETCMKALDNMLYYIDANTDVWLGWTYWAAGPWWGDYMYSIEPKNGTDRPQMAILEKHMANSTRVSEKRIDGMKGFLLHQNYPNPFNGSTRIGFFIPEPSNVELNIRNILGQKILCFVHENFESGYHHISWNAQDEQGRQIDSGIYFIELYNGSNYSCRKMIFTK